jgi:hypothetical protein
VHVWFDYGKFLASGPHEGELIADRRGARSLCWPRTVLMMNRSLSVRTEVYC